MKPAPEVSVIIAAYNHEQFVGEALHSVMAQTYARIELVVIDDGSTDGTFARIRDLEPELTRRCARVHIATKVNEGSGATVSQCLRHARNDLVYLLDSDDVAEPDAITRLLPLLETSDVALAVGDNAYINDRSQSCSVGPPGCPFTTLVAYHTRGRQFSIERDFGSYQSLIEGNYVPNGWLLRRSHVLAVGGYHGGFWLDDWWLLLQLAKKYRICFEDAVLANYRVHVGNTVSTRGRELFLDTARILLAERAYCSAHGLEAEWFRHAYHVFQHLTPAEIRNLASESLSGIGWSRDAAARLDDLARLGRLAVQLEDERTSNAEERKRLVNEHTQALAALRHASAVELEVQAASHESRRLQLEARHAEDRQKLVLHHTAERERLVAYHAAEQQRLVQDHSEANERLNIEASANSARAAALEASRSWRLTRPLRKGFGVLESLLQGDIRLGLDPVKLDPVNLGRVEVSGWAFHHRESVTSLEVTLSGHTLFDLDTRRPRPDVVVAFPGVDIGQPGFRAAAYLTNDRARLRVTLRLKNGHSAVVSRPLPLTETTRQQLRKLYGIPNPLDSSWLGLAKYLLKYGSVGQYIWQSRRLQGWIRGSGEAEALANASASLIGSPTIVEVGSFLGCSAVLLAGPRKQKGAGHVHCVDSFRADGDDAAVPVYRAIANSLGTSMREAFDQNIRRAGLAAWVTVHEMKSDDAVRLWTSPIDMLFLDGDVSIDGSRAIYESWSPFLRPGGILAINGSVRRPSRAGSYRVVEEYVHPPYYEDVTRVDHITLARRSGRP